MKSPTHSGSVIIKESSIHGRGVFACRDFKKSEVVIKWRMDDSNVFTREEADKFPESEKPFFSAVQGKYILLDPPGRYVNHSCAANTFVGKDGHDIARRDIKKGEEITADYEEEKVPYVNIPRCNCGSKNCRGAIRAPSSSVSMSPEKDMEFPPLPSGAVPSGDQSTKVKE